MKLRIICEFCENFVFLNLSVPIIKLKNVIFKGQESKLKQLEQKKDAFKTIFLLIFKDHYINKILLSKVIGKCTKNLLIKRKLQFILFIWQSENCLNSISSTERKQLEWIKLIKKQLANVKASTKRFTERLLLFLGFKTQEGFCVEKKHCKLSKKEFVDIFSRLLNH